MPWEEKSKHVTVNEQLSHLIQFIKENQYKYVTCELALTYLWLLSSLFGIVGLHDDVDDAIDKIHTYITSWVEQLKKTENSKTEV